MLNIYSVAQNQFLQCETKDCYIYCINSTSLLTLTFHSSMEESQFASAWGRTCITVSNFVKIGQTAAKIWRFFHFSRWRRPPSWIFKILNF